ncbi:MAG: hypothetical protein K2Y56_16570 [Methylobacterium sp.]|uniref:hypothetical protein n=1 Tax=Methylobacterium sp. TaxID=409 RepID=UPI0025FB4708|nr:hypothetical protein [Methylobacterium sp.]MBX9933125.1 hypothetical protein [Methylobacterium sp.]
MTRFGTLAATAMFAFGIAGVAGAAQAQLSPQTQDNVGANAAGSKSGVVGKGDSMESAPSTTGTAVAPGTRVTPSDRSMPSTDTAMPPRTGTTSPSR